MSDLWGDLPNVQDAKSPRHLLQEQAEKLEEKTGGVLRGAVRTFAEGSAIVMELDIVAPYINNYSVTVVRLTHGQVIFPLHVIRQLYEEGGYFDRDAVDECHSYAELEASLMKVLQSSRVKAVIESLLIQSKR